MKYKNMKKIISILLLVGSIFAVYYAGGIGASSTEADSTHNNLFETNYTADGKGAARKVQVDENFSETFMERPIVLYAGRSDIRWFDCNNLNEKDTEALQTTFPNITFNEKTVFTEILEEKFRFSKILENGKEPGLNIDSLHQLGITGKGVGIAIIDQPLYLEHPEYASALKLYEEVHVLRNSTGSMHGAAVSSLAVGKDCGVAPEADLYYIGHYSNQDLDSMLIDIDGYCEAIDRIIQINQNLEENKIRVISISRGFMDAKQEELKKMNEAIAKAADEGIFVITCTPEIHYDFFRNKKVQDLFAVAEKIDPLGDPNDSDNYTLVRFNRSSLSLNAAIFESSLLIPVGSRTTADMTENTYTYYSDGGESWISPYLAGLYALCAQVYPSVTPEMFYKMAVETSTEMIRSFPAPRWGTGKDEYHFRMINPQRLVERFAE